MWTRCAIIVLSPVTGMTDHADSVPKTALRGEASYRLMLATSAV